MSAVGLAAAIVTVVILVGVFTRANGFGAAVVTGVVLVAVCMFADLFGAAVVTVVIHIAVGMSAVGLVTAIVTVVILVGIATGANTTAALVAGMIQTGVCTLAYNLTAAIPVAGVVAVAFDIDMIQGRDFSLFHKGLAAAGALAAVGQTGAFTAGGISGNYSGISMLTGNPCAVFMNVALSSCRNLHIFTIVILQVASNDRLLMHGVYACLHINLVCLIFRTVGKNQAGTLGADQACLILSTVKATAGNNRTIDIHGSSFRHICKLYSVDVIARICAGVLYFTNEIEILAVHVKSSTLCKIDLCALTDHKIVLHGSSTTIDLERVVAGEGHTGGFGTVNLTLHAVAYFNVNRHGIERYIAIEFNHLPAACIRDCNFCVRCIGLENRSFAVAGFADKGNIFGFIAGIHAPQMDEGNTLTTVLDCHRNLHIGQGKGSQGESLTAVKVLTSI